MKDTLKEFKDFISSGNLVDTAIAFILALYIKEVVDSFVNGIVLNFISGAVGKADFSSMQFHIGKSPILYGTFITAIVNLVIVGAVMFAIVKAMAAFKKKEEAAAGPSEIDLLTEIRDSLNK
jgi:large conductance mechanosensitive channel